MRIQSVCCPKRRVWLSVFCGALLFTSTLSAQVNTERLRQTHGKTGYITSLGLDFNVLSGNSDKFEIAPNARLDYVSDYWNWFVVGNYKYGESAQKAFTKGFCIGVSMPLWIDRCLGNFLYNVSLMNFVESRIGLC